MKEAVVQDEVPVRSTTSSPTLSWDVVASFVLTATATAVAVSLFVGSRPLTSEGGLTLTINVTRVGIELGCLLMVGTNLLPFLLKGWQAPARGAVWARARALSFAAACLSLACALAQLLARVSQASPDGSVDLSAIVRFLDEFAVGKALVVATLAAAIYAVREQVSRRALGDPVTLELMLAFSVILPVSLSGHATHVSYRWSDLMVLTMIGHVLSAVYWVGGLVVIAALVVRHPPALALALPRFSTIATGCVALVGVTGLVNAAVIAGEVVDRSSFGHLLGSTYGILLMAKTLLLLAILASGAHIRFKFLPSVRAGKSGAARTWMVLEFSLMAAVMGFAAVLSSTSPP